MSGSPRKAIALLGVLSCIAIGGHASRVVTEDGRRVCMNAVADAPSRGPWIGPPSHSRKIKLRRRRKHMERTRRR